MIRVAVQCLLALLMALGVALGGYSLWVSAAHAQSSEAGAETPRIPAPEGTALPAPREDATRPDQGDGKTPLPTDRTDPWAQGSLKVEVAGANDPLFAVVFHETLGTPVAHAAIENGVAEFPALHPGTHEVRVGNEPSRARRHYVAAGSVDVEAGAEARLSLDASSVGDLTIEVRGGPPGQEWVRITRIERLDDPHWAPRTKDTAPPSIAVQGRTITVRGVPHGDYRVRLDHVATEQRVTVPTDGVTVIDVSGR